MIQKDFDKWNELKKKLHESMGDTGSFEEGQIWWCSIGLNIGSEQDGKNDLFERPVLVLKKFNNKIAFITPLTSVLKHNPYHYVLDNNSVILSQARLVSSQRFQRYVRTISDNELFAIKGRFTEVITDLP